MGESGGIDDDAAGSFACIVNPIDDFVFTIALMKLDVEFQFGSQRAAVLLDVGQCLTPIDVRLTLAEQVQVRAVQNIDNAAHRASLSTRPACPEATPVARAIAPRADADERNPE